MLKAVVFDLDGVLIDSEPLMRFAFEATYRLVIGEGIPPIESYLEHMGESFTAIMDHLGLPYTMWAPYREMCQKNIDRIKVYDEGRELLEWARGCGLKMAVLTGKDGVRTVQILEYFNLIHHFAAVVSSDQLSNPKPHPEGMTLTLELLECRPDEAVMIGDSVSDILCAQRAGVEAVAVTWGTKPERVQTLCHPDYVVHDWRSLFQLLSKMFASLEYRVAD